MSTTSTRQVPPVPIRTDTVFMGRQDFFSVVLRLIGVELYKIRRRILSKVLAGIAIGAAIGISLINFALVLLFTREGGPSQAANLIAGQLGLPISLSVVV